MKLHGDFLFLGIESSSPQSEKKWTRVGLTQGMTSHIFYVSNDELLSKIEKLELKLGQNIKAEILISESKGRTYFSLVDIEQA